MARSLHEQWCYGSWQDEVGNGTRLKTLIEPAFSRWRKPDPIITTEKLLAIAKYMKECSHVRYR